MDHRPSQPPVESRALAQRLAGAPISLAAREVPVAPTLQALNEHGYDGWLVLEQDTAITADEPAVTRVSMLAARRSIALNNSAHRTEEINR